ncbi:hypothetical protein GOBAR_DD22726 [Gossypium barbadense]|nr:hypothetical protein GOBAR_DD22726 [Gossypium barbadense]
MSSATQAEKGGSPFQILFTLVMCWKRNCGAFFMLSPFKKVVVECDNSQAVQLLNDGQAASHNLALVDYACTPEEVHQQFQSCAQGLTCSAESPNERIDMSDVVTKLCSIRDKLHPTRLHHEVGT